MSNHRAIASRVARRHLAGLVDPHLVAKAAEHVLRDPAGSIETDLGRSNVSYTSERRSFEYVYKSRASTWNDPTEYDAVDVNIEVAVPNGGTFFTSLTLPARLTVGVPASQIESFMAEVLNRVAHRMKPDGFLLEVLHGADGLEEMLAAENDGVSFNNARLAGARMSEPEPVGRLRVSGGKVTLTFKVKASFNCSYAFEVTDPELFTPDPY